MFAPDKTKGLSVWWVVAGLVIVGGLMWSSLVLPAGIRARRRKLLDLGRYATMEDLAEFERARYTFRGWRDDPYRGVLAIGATYAMLDCRDTADAAVGYPGSTRLLPKEDSLVWELYRQDRMEVVP